MKEEKTRQEEVKTLKVKTDVKAGQNPWADYWRNAGQQAGADWAQRGMNIGRQFAGGWW
jgi:hypothetical protein